MEEASAGNSEDASSCAVRAWPLLTTGGADQHWRRQRSSASASTPATPRRHAGGAVAARSTNTACARSFGGCSPHRSPLASRWGRARAVERPLCRYVGGPKGADAPPRAACSRVLVGGRSGVDRHVRPSLLLASTATRSRCSTFASVITNINKHIEPLYISFLSEPPGPMSPSPPSLSTIDSSVALCHIPRRPPNVQEGSMRCASPPPPNALTPLTGAGRVVREGDACQP